MLGVWIEVDCGYGRSGVDPSSDAGPVLARRIADSPRLALRGCLTHAGHAYHGEDPDAIAGIAEHERRTMVEFGVRLREIGIDPGDLSVGSTPGMAHVRSLEGIDEARPGNYALFDYTQVRLGSCKVSDCAATVLSTVVSSAPARGQSVSDAGALVLSKDTGPDRPPHYGRVFESPEGAALSPDARIVSVSQEHATISASFPVGTRLRILPNHSCLTVACFDHFTLVRNQRVVGQWRIWRCRGPASTLPALSRQP